jgi:hypothetical protein
MGGMGPAGKHPSTRRGHNSKPGNIRQLVADDEIEAPELPDNPDGWHYQTLEWWDEIWRSPMAPEYDDSDIQGLYVMARCVDDFWNARSPTERQKASAEVRLHSMRFGLSPMDRRRLQWEIAKVDDAQAKAKRRAAAEAVEVKLEAETDDPRNYDMDQAM